MAKGRGVVEIVICLRFLDFVWMEKIRGDLQMLKHKRTDLYEVVSKFKDDEL